MFDLKDIFTKAISRPPLLPKVNTNLNLSRIRFKNISNKKKIQWKIFGLEKNSVLKSEHV